MISANRSQSWSCPNNFWSYDDIDSCHRQRYFEVYLVGASLGVSLLLAIWDVFGSKNSSKELGEDNASLVFHPEGAVDPTALVKLRVRSISDRLRLVAELALNAASSAISILLYFDSNNTGRYKFASNAPGLLVALSLYNGILSLYRLVCYKQNTQLKGRPFIQQCILYPAVLLVFSVNYYSQNLHPATAVVKKLFTLGALISLVNWVILYSSPIGDYLPRQYISQGKTKTDKSYAEPSTESSSSIFEVMTCQWSLPILKKSMKKRLDFNDTLELSENDHSYYYLEKYDALPESWGFSLRMFYILKGPLFLTSFYGCVSSLLKLTPTLFIQKILEFLESQSVPKSVGWLYVFMLGFCYMVQTIAENQSLFQGRKLSIGVRALIMGTVYRKTLLRKISKTESTAQDPNASSSDSETSGKEKPFDPYNTGAVLNLMSVDSFRVASLSAYVSDVITIPLLIFLSLFFLYNILGWSAFVAFGIMLIMLPLILSIGFKLNSLNASLLATTDIRIEKTNEILDAIRIVKYYAWGRRLIERVLKVRVVELHAALLIKLWAILNDVGMLSLPVVVTVVTFWSYIKLQGQELTTSVAFTSLSVLYLLRFPMVEIGSIISMFASAYASLSRISKFLNSSDTAKYEQLKDTTLRDGEEFIGFDNATLSWASNDADDEGSVFKLRNIDLKFSIEDLNVIVGPTGSGKSSLLLALLGEMKLEKGSISLPGSHRRNMLVNPNTGFVNAVAYVPQEAWLLNDTLKRNILFAEKFDQSRYNAVLDVCQLRRDLEILNQGDQTLIGDKGVSLSGGQKQRVSLARALYSKSRHLLLDDCLSAVDSHTSEALYREALTGPLAKNRTIILVSHNVSLTISRAANLLIMENGRLVAQGTPEEVVASGKLGEDELINKNASLAAKIRSENGAESTKSTLSRDQSPSPSNSNTVQVGSTNLLALEPTPEEAERGLEQIEEDAELAEEERAEGSIPFAVYIKVMNQMGGYKFAFVLIGLLVIVGYIDYFLSYWIKLWASNSTGTDTVKRIVMSLSQGNILVSFKSNNFINVSGFKVSDNDSLANLNYYGTGYIIIGFVYIFFVVIRDLILYYGSIRVSRIIFRELLLRVVHARTRFFDTTPSGRIVNRFAQDMVTIDQSLGFDFLILAQSVLDAVRVTVVISWVTPLLIPVILSLVFLLFLVSYTYFIAARELKRLESVTNSPIFQQFGEALSGSVVIRAYGDIDRFIDKNLQLIDEVHRPYFWLWMANRWLAFWCTTMSICVCVLAAALIMKNSSTIDPGMAGISLSLSTSFGDALIWLVRMCAQLQIDMNSVQRLYEYTDVEQEAPDIIPESRPPKNWPSRGNVEFKNLSLQYSDDLPMVIKNVSFEVGAGKKIGIVGRTGAGKSTIIMALFRMLEPSTGTVLIDDVDITTIGLEDLRTGLSIIPQDPTLFKGTLRSNLDLFSDYGDDELFKALSYVNLVPENTTAASASTERAKDSGAENVNQFLDLETEISEGGRNLSQGQRQLLCLARAILKSPKIMMLDEATASIDYETDSTIQKTIRKAFNNTTIITVAHRLRTIADYDKIVVLEQGNVVQFAHPYDLLQDKEGIFYSMCEKSGELESLLELAKSTHTQS